MRNVRSLRFWGIFLAIAAVAVFAAAALEPGAQVSPRGPLQPLRPGIDKIRPIAFEIGQDSALTKKCAAKVESDNAMLATMLAEMRLDIAAGKAFDRAAWERRMATTYLKDPVITTEDGQPHPGWANVFDVLTGIVGRSTYIDAQSVHVSLEYLAYKSPEYIRFNGQTAPALADEIDFVAHIKTVLAYAPNDDPVRIEGALRHSKVCVWEP